MFKCLFFYEVGESFDGGGGGGGDSRLNAIAVTMLILYTLYTKKSPKLHCNCIVVHCSLLKSDHISSVLVSEVASS